MDSLASRRPNLRVERGKEREKRKKRDSVKLIEGSKGLKEKLNTRCKLTLFNFQFINYPVFNVADICVVSGAIIGAIYYLWFYEQHDGGQHGKADAGSSS